MCWTWSDQRREHYDSSIKCIEEDIVAGEVKYDVVVRLRLCGTSVDALQRLWNVLKDGLGTLSDYLGLGKAVSPRPLMDLGNTIRQSQSVIHMA